jgi:hypothetical protein
MMNKYQFAAKIIADYKLSQISIIDVGCRDGILKKYLNANKYFGIDVDSKSAADKIVDIGKKTEFDDKEFELLLALDVAEHTDNIYGAICEMLRISQNAIIAVPNMYNLHWRYRFIKGEPLCGKYRLTKESSLSGGERHRWVFPPGEAIELMNVIALEQNMKLQTRYYYPPSGPLRLMSKFVNHPNLTAEALYFVFKNK